MIRLALLLALAHAWACTDTYDYDPVSAGDDEGDRGLRGKSPAQFVRGVYADLLGRSPETYDFVVRIGGQEVLRFPLAEERQLVTALEGLGDSLPLRNLMTKGILHSAEVTLPDKATVAEPAAFIREQFRRLLGREPNPYELAVFVDAWASDPAVGPRTIIRAIVGSREYQSQ
jgi:hypothetical protein